MFDDIHLCACLGPQDGLPKCPCGMNRVHVVNGRYVDKDTKEDLGPYIFINKSRVEQVDITSHCQHADHNPDFDIIKTLTMDQAYFHVCPMCKAEYRCGPTTQTFLKFFFMDEQ
jgi:hypothetical protein